MPRNDAVVEELRSQLAAVTAQHAAEKEEMRQRMARMEAAFNDFISSQGNPVVIAPATTPYVADKSSHVSLGRPEDDLD